MQHAVGDVMVVVLSLFRIEQVHLVVQHLHRYKHYPSLLRAEAKSLHLTSFWVLLVEMLVVVVGWVLVKSVEEERQQD